MKVDTGEQQIFLKIDTGEQQIFLKIDTGEQIFYFLFFSLFLVQRKRVLGSMIQNKNDQTENNNMRLRDEIRHNFSMTKLYKEGMMRVETAAV